MPYFPFFQTLYDETAPAGNLGRGTHYSVFRAVCWHDGNLSRLEQASFLDFAVIWDEDHDKRVMEPLSQIYFAGLLAPVRFIGERKGFLSVLLDPQSIQSWNNQKISSYTQRIEKISQGLGDPWSATVRTFTDREHSIISDTDDKISIYLRNIVNLWSLGPKAISTQYYSDGSAV